jgi:hypothetical protein
LTGRPPRGYSCAQVRNHAAKPGGEAMTSKTAPEDYVAICNIKARYCRMIDIKDWDGVAALVTDDFELDMSEASPLPVIRGRDEAIDATRRSMAPLKTAHQVHLPEIEIDGDSAHAIFPMQDRVVWDGGGLTGYGHYHERYVRRGGGWLIAATKLTRLHVDLQPQPVV